MPVTQNKLITPQLVRTAVTLVTGVAGSLGTATPSGLSLLLSGGASGSRIVRVEASVHETCVATRALFYRSSDGGTTKRLWRSKVIAAYTASNTADPSTFDLGFSDLNPLYFASASDQIYVGLYTAVTAGIVFAAEVLDY